MKSTTGKMKNMYFTVNCSFKILGLTISVQTLFPVFPDTPSQRVQFLLGTEDDDEEHIPHDLFTEMDEICVRDGEDCEWRESARYRSTAMSLTSHLHTAMTYMS